MLHVLGCITEQHDLRLVVLAGVLCLFACATAMSLLARARATLDKSRMWIAAAGLVAGCGIWGTHFVAMLAFRAGFPVAYDPTLTVLSVLIAVLLCGVGFSLALGRAAGPGDRRRGDRRGDRRHALCRHGRGAGAGSGAVGLAYVVASVVIGVAAMALRHAGGQPRQGLAHLCGGAVIFTLAICSMHFTGMSAVTFRPDPSIVVPDACSSRRCWRSRWRRVAILIMALGLVGALVDSPSVRPGRWGSDAVAHPCRRTGSDQGAAGAHLRKPQLALDAADAAIKAKSAFLAAMSHELRTPLNAVIGFSDMLSMETFGSVGSARNKEYLNDIHASGRHLLALINDILDIARIDAGQAELNEEIVDLKALARIRCGMVTPQANAATHPSGGRHRSRGAIGACRRAPPEAGADQSAGQCGEVHQCGRHGRHHARVARPDGLAIVVSDTGIGIAEKDIPSGDVAISARSIPPWRANMRAPGWACRWPSS